MYLVSLGVAGPYPKIVEPLRGILVNSSNIEMVERFNEWVF